MQYGKSLDYLNRAKRIIPLCSQTFSKGPAYFPQGASPVYLKSGNGSHVTDVDGNSYIDYICGLGPITLGYNYPRVNDAIIKQLQDGIIFSLPHPLEVEMAELLVEVIPCAKMVRFFKTGSEATSAAIRVARQWTGLDRIIFRGYHGWHEWYCYSDDTEILTEEGFKLIKNIGGDEKVATLNPSTHEIEYHPIEQKLEFDYNESLLHFQAKRLDLMVTPNHQIYRAYYNNHGEAIFRSSSAQEQLKYADSKYIRMYAGGKWKGSRAFLHKQNGKPHSAFYIPKVVRHGKTKNIRKFPIIPFLRFLGWYLSEGSCNKSSKVINIAQSPKHASNVNEIMSTIKELGFNPWFDGRHSIVFSSKELYDYLLQFGKAHDKYVPRWIMKLPVPLIKVFIESFAKGDGAYQDGKLKALYSCSKRLMDDFQELLIKCNIGSTLGYNGTWGYQLSVSKPYKETTKPKLVPYQGKIYCVDVKNHLILVRRNGKPVWSGNSIASERPKGIPEIYGRFIEPFTYNDVESVRQLLGKGDDAAAIIMEPTIVDPPRDNFLQEIRQLATDYEAVLIFDEIVTGFRMSLGGAQEYFGVTPDLATFGKGMANGMPLNAVVGRADIMKGFEDVFVSSTFGGECLSLAAGVATISEMQEKKTIGWMWELGRVLQHGMEELGLEVKGYPCRPMFVLPDDSTYTRSLFMQEVIKRGVLIHSGCMMNLCYSHSLDDIWTTLDVFEEVLKLMKKGKVELKGELVQPAFKRL